MKVEILDSFIETDNIGNITPVYSTPHQCGCYYGFYIYLQSSQVHIRLSYEDSKQSESEIRFKINEMRDAVIKAWVGEEEYICVR